MKFLSPRAHAWVDYLLVALFAVAPFLFDMGDVASALCWVLAPLHLLMSLLTAYPGGVARVLAFPTHGVLELLIGAALVVFPWVLGFQDEAAARNFFLTAGVGVLFVWVVTDYRAADVLPGTPGFDVRERHA